MIAGALRDNDRHVETVQALVQHVIADPETGRRERRGHPRLDRASGRREPRRPPRRCCRCSSPSGETEQAAADALALLVTAQNSIVEAAGVKA